MNDNDIITKKSIISYPDIYLNINIYPGRNSRLDILVDNMIRYYNENIEVRAYELRKIIDFLKKLHPELDMLQSINLDYYTVTFVFDGRYTFQFINNETDMGVNIVLRRIK